MPRTPMALALPKEEEREPFYLNKLPRTVVSVNLSPTLVSWLDRAVELGLFSTRSEAIRYSIFLLVKELRTILGEGEEFDYIISEREDGEVEIQKGTSFYNLPYSAQRRLVFDALVALTRSYGMEERRVMIPLRLIYKWIRENRGVVVRRWRDKKAIYDVIRNSIGAYIHAKERTILIDSLVKKGAAFKRIYSCVIVYVMPGALKEPTMPRITA